VTKLCEAPGSYAVTALEFPPCEETQQGTTAPFHLTAAVGLNPAMKTFHEDALATNEIDAMVAMLAMENVGNGAIVAMVAMGGDFRTRRMQPLLHGGHPGTTGILSNI